MLEILATGKCRVFFEIICLIHKKYSKLCLHCGTDLGQSMLRN